MQAEFRPPRRRTRVYEDYEAPLPLSRNPQDRKRYRGELVHQQVLVCHPDHIQSIHNQGYFGKGVLSRARPNHSVSDQWEQHKGLLLPVVSQSRYVELLRWAEAALSSQGLDEEAVSQTLLALSETVEVEEAGGGEMEAVGRAEGGGGEVETVGREEGGGGEVETVGRGEGGGGEVETVGRGEGGGGEVETVGRGEGGGGEVETVGRGEGGGGKVEEANGLKGGEPGGGAGVQMKRLWAESAAEPEVKRSCRSTPQNLDPSSEPDSDSSSDSDSDPGCGLRVPGPGYVLVESESQEGGGVREVRRSPLALTEYLQLSLEEAFFLVYSLGVLSVYLQQEPLSVIELWRKFRSLRPDFVSSYAAYHHFRSRGWVPKGGGGAKYGVDLMLYRKGPPFYHASYSVVVERTAETVGGAALRPFSWRSLAALSRITGSVSKELMLCYIIYPADLSEEDLHSPVCLSKLKLQEVIVSRWVSSRERAEQDDI